MESIRQRGASIEGIIKLSSMSFFVLSIICFMVFTTQNYTHADEDLGYDIKSANASVTVGTACTFTATVDSAHSANISNGISGTDIGKTTLSTVCNDSGGYAIYAIGFSNDEYGATDLSSDISSTYNISTGTNTSGDSSSWAMKLTSEPGTTTATIENGYDNYNMVPDDYTKVATLNTVTDPGSTTSATGSSVSTTYQTYISPTQPAGTYTGKVKYTLVHPSTSPKPIIPDISELTYMQDLARIGESDMAALKNSMPEGQQYILKDNRDGKDYYISKLADGNIWMTQNLDLDLSTEKTLTPADTNITADWTPANSTISFTDTSVPGWQGSNAIPYSANPGDVYYYTSNTNDDDIKYNSLAECEAAGHTDCAHYHAGNYYNWTAAVASNDTSSIAEPYSNAPGSICPAGWRLPKNANAESYVEGNEQIAMVTSYNGILGEYRTDGPPGGHYDYVSGGFKKIRITPLWLVRVGIINEDGSFMYAGNTTQYWSSTNYSELNVRAYSLQFSNDSVLPAINYSRARGHSVRCVAQ